MSTSKRLSMFSLRFPSYHSDKSDSKNELPQVSDADSAFETPSAGTSSSVPFFETSGDDAAAGQTKKVVKRKSRLGLLSNYVSRSLTSKSTDELSSYNTPSRKPLPAHPSAVGDYRPPLPHDLFQRPEGGFPNPTLGYQPPPQQQHAPPVQQQHHARQGSLPNMLKKIRISAPDLRVEGSHQAPLPPKHSMPILAVPHPTEPQLAVQKTRGGPRSNFHDRVPSNGQQGYHSRNASSTSMSSTRHRSSSAQAPAVRAGQRDSGVASVYTHSRDSSTASLHQPESGKKIKKGWLRSRAGSEASNHQGQAWIIAPGNTADYNTFFLSNGDRIPELWDEGGDVFVFLGSRGSRYGPSFRVTSYIISTSRFFQEMIQDDAAMYSSRGRNRERSFGGQSNLMARDAHRSFTAPVGAGGPAEANIYLDILDLNKSPDLERLIAVRNLFAFLTGVPLVATRNHPSVFSAFLQIAKLLKQFDFASPDGTSFGVPVDIAFQSCMEQFNLADVRDSPSKTIEAVVLGEQMRSAELYNEGFVHAVGMHDSIRELKSPLWNSITDNARQRIERAHLDLFKRLQNNTYRLENFEVPSLFAGIASSVTTLEYKDVRFKEWQKNYAKMRTFALGYYKDLFGHWPPKARSKKNPFSESGLNRQCLKVLYMDMCTLYDLLVDRESVTPRVMDQSPLEIHEASNDARISALRRMLTEYDQSSPPVLPPIPYDVPKLPTMTTIRANYNELSSKEQLAIDKDLKNHELALILIKSHNIATDQLRNVSFLNAFKDFEQKEARGSSQQDLADQRIGYWLFLYVVIQALPMLVVDAPDVRYTGGVEYFLCEPPMGNLPWVEDGGEVRKMWYGVAGGQNIVELSADTVMFSVEMTYHRSHCWMAAKTWEAEAAFTPQKLLQTTNTTTAAQAATFNNPLPPPSMTSLNHAASFTPMSPLEPPRGVFQDLDPVSSPISLPGTGGAGTPPHASSPTLIPTRGPRHTSPSAAAGGHRTTSSGHPGYRSSIVLGLEPLSHPPPAAVETRSISDSYHTANHSRSRSRPRSSRPASGASGSYKFPKSGSVGNLHQLAKDSAGETAAAAAAEVTGGSTFDDILAGIEKDNDKGKDGKKKKGFF